MGRKNEEEAGESSTHGDAEGALWAEKMKWKQVKVLPLKE